MDRRKPALQGGLWLVALSACTDPFLHEVPAIPEPPPVVEQECPTGSIGAPTAVVWSDRIELSWSPRVDDTYRLRVLRAAGAAASFTEIATDLPADTRQHVDRDATCVAPNTQCRYLVRAVHPDCATRESATIVVVALPSAPDGVSAQALDTTVTLRWSDNNTYEDGYRVFRTSGGSETLVGTCTVVASAPCSGPTELVDEGLPSDTEITYRVEAFIGEKDWLSFGDSPDEGVASSSPTTVWTAPAAPSDLVATPSTVAGTPPTFPVSLSWSAPGPTATSIRLQRVAAALDESLLADATAYDDLTAPSNTSCQYRLQAANADGALSRAATITVLTLPAPPGQPSATGLSTTDIELVWVDPHPGLVTFRIERSPAGANTFSLLAAGLDTNTYTDTGLSAETAFDYRVFTVNASGESVPTEVRASTSFPAPTSLGTAEVRADGVTLTWTRQSTSGDQFAVEWRISPSGAWSNATISTANTITIDGLSPDTTYDFRVRDENAASGGFSDWVQLDGVLTGAAPILAWSGTATLDSTCTVTIVGTATFSDAPNPTATFSSAAGTIGPITAAASETGLSASTLGYAPGLWNVSWTVDDDLGASATLTKQVQYALVNAQSRLFSTTLPLPSAASEGQQLWVGTEPVYSGVCGDCVGAPGALAVGGDGVCLVRTGGTVGCWGAHPGSGVDASNAVATVCSADGCPTPLSGIVAVTRGGDLTNAGQSHACAVNETGEVYCWGDNAHRQVRNEGAATLTTPGLVCTPDVNGTNACAGGSTAVSAVAVSAGATHTCALSTTGTVVCWGDNNRGQLGTGDTGDNVPPATVCAAGIWNGTACTGTGATELSGVVALSSGAAHTCALLDDQTVRCWGDNAQGQLGCGQTCDNASPHVNPEGVCESGDWNGNVCAGGTQLSGVVAIAAGNTHSCALLSDGTLRCWGDNAQGQLGLGTASPATTNVAVPVCDAAGSFDGSACTAGDASGFGAIAASVGSSNAGDDRTCALATDGDVWCWGLNAGGQLGTGSTSPTNVLAPELAIVSDAVALALGESISCALLGSGQVACWGQSSTSLLGGGETTVVDTPTAVLDDAAPLLGTLRVCGEGAISDPP